MRIGFIGAGLMGRPMARRLIAAGHQLFVWGRRYDTVEPLLVLGAVGKASPAEVAGEVEALITMVADTADVEDVLVGARGAIHGMSAGLMAVDMSTIAPAGARRLGEIFKRHGADFLDAPVSGGVMGAEGGTLSIMVGGDAQVFDRALPLLRVLGSNVVHVGGWGAGQVVKACNQIVVSLTLQGIAEAIQLARANGVDGARMREALLGGFAASRILEVHGARMLAGDYAPGFKVRLHHKDLGIVLENARQTCASLPGVALVAQEMSALMAAGDGDLDSSALLRVLQRMAGA